MELRLIELAARYQMGSALFMALACLAEGPHFSVGVLCGGALMSFNFWFFKRFMEKLRAGASERSKMIYGFLMTTKMFILLGLLTFLVMVVKLDVLGMTLGVSTFFVGMVLGLAHYMLAPSRVVG
jgi:hypothetical protein